ncbi:hypothetical protein KHO53_01565 [Pseudomonas sp. RC2C2]|nr:hypothetical protein [Pseudomonas sp. RC2C2]
MAVRAIHCQHHGDLRRSWCAYRAAVIEHVRAGNQGRDFAVVTDEVQALVRRASDATGEIDQLLGGLAARTQGVTQEIQKSMGMSLSRAQVVFKPKWSSMIRIRALRLAGACANERAPNS